MAASNLVPSITAARTDLFVPAERKPLVCPQGNLSPRIIHVGLSSSIGPTNQFSLEYLSITDMAAKKWEKWSLDDL